MPIVTKKINQELICWVDKRDYVPKADLRKVVDEYGPKGRGLFDMTHNEIEVAYMRLCRGVEKLLERGE